MSAREKAKRVSAQPRKVATAHPNATTSTTGGALATVLIWFFTVVLGLPMDAVTGAAFATLFGAGALFVGRKAPWFRTTELEPALMDPDPDNPP